MQNQPPLDILIHETKAKIITLINNSGLPPAIMDPILCSALADIRGQSNIELLNYIKTLETKAATEETVTEDGEE